ncbi:helix-turn-helix domain-containing protein [Candidatus Leptofilum sp.]|uniref:helix-turn-helix domain-containing protein n=1 Tax=Candidatus Leptofilum sp. TaxID=3241576 RepID=UPI003B593D72
MTQSKSDLLLHPVRMRLVTELAGRQMTPRQLAAAMSDVAQATLYRHIRRLLDGGIFEVVAEQVVNGATERTYGVVSGSARLTADEMQSVSAEQHVRYFSTFAAALIDTFARYAQQSDPADFASEGLSYNRAVIYLTDEERIAFQTQIINLVGQVMANQPALERKRFTLASVTIPEERVL